MMLILSAKSFAAAALLAQERGGSGAVTPGAAGAWTLAGSADASRQDRGRRARARGAGGRERRAGAKGGKHGLWKRFEKITQPFRARS